MPKHRLRSSRTLSFPHRRHQRQPPPLHPHIFPLASLHHSLRKCLHRCLAQLTMPCLHLSHLPRWPLAPSRRNVMLGITNGCLRSGAMHSSPCQEQPQHMAHQAYHTQRNRPTCRRMVLLTLHRRQRPLQRQRRQRLSLITCHRRRMHLVTCPCILHRRPHGAVAPASAVVHRMTLTWDSML